MKMRVFGFSWVSKHLPKDLPTSAAFERIAEPDVSGKVFGDHLAAVASIDGDWWGGLLLKVRDAKSFTKLYDNHGVLTVTSEKMAEGEQLAETNFFIAHKSNGHGLYCHHHLSSSLIGDFGDFCARRFAERVKAKCEELVAGKVLARFDKNKLLKAVKGRLVIEQILKGGTFDAHVRSLKRITELEGNLVSFEMKNSDFMPLVTNARRKKIVLGYGEDALTGQIASGIVECRKQGLFERLKVLGRDKEGHEQIYKTNHDSLVFDEWEYDQMVESLTVRFDDLSGSITKSTIITKLLELTNSPKVRKELGIV